MGQKILETAVDQLVEIVKQNPNCEISFICKQLNLPSDLVEKWLVVLEEFKILKIEYKGFSGFVNISDSLKKHENKKEIDIDQIKNIYVEKSKSKGISIQKMQELWPNFLQKYEADIHNLFVQKAKNAGYPEQKIEIAWQRFREELNTL